MDRVQRKHMLIAAAAGVAVPGIAICAPGAILRVLILPGLVLGFSFGQSDRPWNFTPFIAWTVAGEFIFYAVLTYGVLRSFYWLSGQARKDKNKLAADQHRRTLTGGR